MALNEEDARLLADYEIGQQSALNGLPLTVVEIREDPQGWEYTVGTRDNHTGLGYFYIFVEKSGTVSTSTAPFIIEQAASPVVFFQRPENWDLMTEAEQGAYCLQLAGQMGVRD